MFFIKEYDLNLQSTVDGTSIFHLVALKSLILNYILELHKVNCLHLLFL